MATKSATKKLTYAQAMGKLGNYTANPTMAEKAAQAELDQIASHYLLKGKRPKKGSGWLTERQLKTRADAELQFGDHIERASRTSSSWLSQMPKLPRITQPEY